MSSKSAQSSPDRGRASGAPWATFVLLAACTLAFTAAQLAASATEASTEAELHTAIEYWNSHVHLDPGPVLSRRIDPGVVAHKRALQDEARIRRGTPPIPQAVQARQQQQLDELVAAAFAGAASLPDQRWGFRATSFDPLTLFTHAYLHTGPTHLLGSLFLLLLLGLQLESSWGSATFLTVAVIGGVVSALVYGLANAGFEPPLVGMSGTLAALLAAFAVRCRALWQQPVYPFLLLCGAAWLIVPTRWGAEWSIAEGLGQAQLLVEHRGASLWAVVGGLAAGLLAEGTIALLATASPAAGDGAGRRTRAAAGPELARAIQARDAGKLSEARDLLVRSTRGADADPEALVLLWDVALAQGKPAEASTAMLRAIRADIQANDLDAAAEHWLDLSNRGLAADAEPALLIRVAVALQQREHHHAAVSALRQALGQAEGVNRAVIASRVARASRDLDPDTARDAAWRALGALDLDFAERQALESMLGEIGPGIDLGDLVGRGRDRALDVDLGGDPVDAAPAAEEPETPQRPEVWVDSALSEEAEVVELEHVVAAAEAPASTVPRESIAVEFPARTARAVAATPLGLDARGLLVEVGSGSKKRVPLDRIEALAVALVGGLGPEAVVIVDLVMNWESGADEPLKILRMRGDRFDPATLVPGDADRLETMRAFTRELLYQSATIGLPDDRSAAGMPFASYDDLASYERSVLGIDASRLGSGS